MWIHDISSQMSQKEWQCLTIVAVSAGLGLAFRWWMARRSLRYRALQVLGYRHSGGARSALRYSAVAAAIVATVMFLTPVSPGIGDVEPAKSNTPTPPTPSVVIEVGFDDGPVIRVDGLEIRFATAEPTAAQTNVGVSPSLMPDTSQAATSVPPAHPLEELE
jgi:hypothetical protein